MAPLRSPAAVLTIVLGTVGCASVSPKEFVKAVADDVASAPEIARQRQAALAVVSTYYGSRRRPLDVPGARTSAVHAARVYQSLESVRSELGENVHVVPVVTAISGLQYYVFDEGERQVVAIRGTRPAEIRNWVANLVISGAIDEFLRVDVHEGFLLATRIIELGLFPRLDQRRPVHLTGHSLGGSLATLLGLRLQRRGYEVSVTTFGAPKITTFDAFANEPRLHELDLTRILNAGDVVHHFPTMMDTSGRRVYAQFGREWTLDADRRCAQTELATSLTKSAALVLDRNMPDWSLAEHDMETYVARLSTLDSCGEAKQS